MTNFKMTWRKLGDGLNKYVPNFIVGIQTVIVFKTNNIIGMEHYRNRGGYLIFN